MWATCWFGSGSGLPRSRVVSSIAAASAAVLMGSLSFGCEQAWADEVCGPGEAHYAESVAAGLQPFAAKTTKTGHFAFKDDYPGNGSAAVVISFLDNGRTLFSHRVIQYKDATGTAMTPGKTKSGEPGFKLSLLQGTMGACEYGVFVRNQKFVVVSMGLKQR
jgi:hypothetical protein